MVSSLNHHISILRLRVHSLYIQHLTEGTLPEELPADPQWCSPVLQRTRWYDLFSIEDRKEAVRGIWGLFSYLMRRPTVDSTGETIKKPKDVVMKDVACIR